MRKIRFWMWCLTSIVAGILLSAMYQSGSDLPEQVDQLAGILLTLGIIGIVVWAIRGWRRRKQANAQPAVEDDPNADLRAQVEKTRLDASLAKAKLELAEAEKKLKDLDED